jgi:hypothetical protein
VVHEPDTLLLDSGGFGSNVVRKGNTFLRPLKKKGCKEARVASMRWDNLSTSTTLESNKSLLERHAEKVGALCQGREHQGELS